MTAKPQCHGDCRRNTNDKPNKVILNKVMKLSTHLQLVHFSHEFMKANPSGRRQNEHGLSVTCKQTITKRLWRKNKVTHTSPLTTTIQYKPNHPLSNVIVPRAVFLLTCTLTWNVFFLFHLCGIAWWMRRWEPASFGDRGTAEQRTMMDRN